MRLRNSCAAQVALQNQMSGPQSLETAQRSEGISSENKTALPLLLLEHTRVMF